MREKYVCECINNVMKDNSRYPVLTEQIFDV